MQSKARSSLYPGLSVNTKLKWPGYEVKRVNVMYVIVVHGCDHIVCECLSFVTKPRVRTSVLDLF